MTRLRPLYLLIVLLATVAVTAVPSRSGQTTVSSAGDRSLRSSTPGPRSRVRRALPEDRTVARGSFAWSGVHPESTSPVQLVRDAAVLSGGGIAIGGGNEPSIAVDPNNPNRIVLLSFVGAWGATAPLFFSTDGGINWSLQNTIGFPPGDPFGGPNDQTPDFGLDGNLYGTFLSCDASGNCKVFSGSTSNPASAASWAYFLVGGNAQQTDFNGTLNASDQPWLLANRDPSNPAQVDTYVAYDDFSAVKTRVSVARGTAPPNFVADNAVDSFGGVNASGNPGTRLVKDPTNGWMYAIWQRGNANPAPNRDYVLRRSTDAGATWTNPVLGGGAVVAADSDQTGPAPTGKFGTVNALLGGVQHGAVDPTTGDFYYVFGDKAGSSSNRLGIIRLQYDFSGNLVPGPEHFVGITGTGSVQSALPSVAVANNGTIGVLYVTFDGFSSTVDPANPPLTFPVFSDHFATSDDHGATWKDQVLLTFLSTTTFNGVPFDNQRELGDYDQVKAVGRYFYGTFCGNGAALGAPTAAEDTMFFKAFAGGPVAQINPTDLLFGDVCPGQVKDLPFDVFNTGSTDLHVVSIAPLPGSDPNFLVLPDPSTPTTVSPDAHVTYTVRMIGFGTPGFKAAVFRITTDDPDRPTIDLVADGTVGAPKITVQGCPVDFGSVALGDAGGHEKEIQIANTGTCDLHVTGVAFTPPTADFQLLETAPTPGNPLTISPDSFIPFHIKFTPTSSGTKNAVLVITNSDGLPPENCSVTGTTQAASAADLNAPAGIGFPPTVIQAFGPSHSDNSPAISNDGSGLMRINSVTLGGANPGDYSLVGLPSAPIFLPPGGILGAGDFKVRFSPTFVTRTDIATLQIAIGDPVSGTKIGEVDVPLSGEGVRPGARLLVKLGAIPAPNVAMIQLQHLHHPTEGGSDFDTFATFLNVKPKTVNPAAPGLPFIYHIENGGVDSNKYNRLLPGSTYRYVVYMKIGKKVVKKQVAFFMDSQHTFNSSLEVDF